GRGQNRPLTSTVPHTHSRCSFIETDSLKGEFSSLFVEATSRRDSSSDEVAQEMAPDPAADEATLVGQISSARDTTNAGSIGEATKLIALDSSSEDEATANHLSPIRGAAGARSTEVAAAAASSISETIKVIALGPATRGTSTKYVSLIKSIGEPSNVDETLREVALDLADEEMVAELMSPIRGVVGGGGATIIGGPAAFAAESLGFGNLLTTTSGDVQMLHDFVSDLDVDRVDLPLVDLRRDDTPLFSDTSFMHPLPEQRLGSPASVRQDSLSGKGGILEVEGPLPREGAMDGGAAVGEMGYCVDVVELLTGQNAG
ncbi:hypothetical protein ACLOJK_040910, partial [Asimina triloba]